MDLNTFCSKKAVLVYLQIPFAKLYYERELSKNWRIWYFGQILQETSVPGLMLVYFYGLCWKRVVLACLQIHFGERYFERELRKTWHILASGHCSIQRAGSRWVLVYSFGFQHNIVNENGFGLFAFCKTVFSARVEQDSTQFTDWPNFAGNMGSRVNCGALSQTLTESNGKNRFWIVYRYFLQDRIFSWSWATPEAFYALAKFRRRHWASTGL